MDVRLTDTGMRLFARGPGMEVVGVTMDRAYNLMQKGYANKDKPFMALYEANNPKPEEKVEVVTEQKPKPEIKPMPKKEKATSKKAEARETAVKE